jgi:hypothetical protein
VLPDPAASGCGVEEHDGNSASPAIDVEQPDAGKIRVEIAGEPGVRGRGHLGDGQ